MSDRINKILDELVDKVKRLVLLELRDKIQEAQPDHDKIRGDYGAGKEEAYEYCLVLITDALAVPVDYNAPIQ